MSAARKAWIVAASIGAVEALKDQGICRWNYTIRSIHQYAKSNLRSLAQANNKHYSTISSSPSSTMGNVKPSVNMSRREASMEKVMNLSCWGPSTARF